MTDIPQPVLGNYPVPGPTPQPYIGPADCMELLSVRYPRFSLPAPPGVGDMLVASMALDEEAPFLGVKVDVRQDREFPRTYKYGWPNIVSAPSPLLVARSYGGAWLLDYDKVVPQQVLDWVCLEVWRELNLDQTKVTTRESVGGASVQYAPPVEYSKGQMSQLDRVQQMLLSPFQGRAAHVVPFIFWDGE